MQVSIESNIEEIAKDLDTAAKKQLPFATALALTWTAGHVRDHLRETLPNFFQVRGPFVPNSIRSTMTKKGAAPVVQVGSVFPRMQEHVEGGERAGEDAIPYRARKTPESKTTRKNWPASLLAHKAGFFVKASKFGGATLFQRIGKKGRHLRLWWVLAPDVKVKPRWPFEKLARSEIGRVIDRNFVAALDRALKTAR